MKTIVVYTSQTGFTQKYAGWIGKRLGAEIIKLDEAKKKPAEYFDGADAIIYGGWAMAGKMTGSEWFVGNIERWKGKKLAMFLVGGSPIDNPDVDTTLNTLLTDEQRKYAKAFYCQGGIAYDRMKLPSKLAMKAFAKVLSNSKKSDKEREMGKYLSQSYDIADERYTDPIVEYILA